MAVTADLIAFAEHLADTAGEIVRRHFRTPVPVDFKDDESPVTEVDRAAEAAMRTLIRARFPDHGVAGEEHGIERGDAEHVWCLDPIDGTKSFITGRPQFGTLVGLARRGRPVLGVIDQPILGERWLGVEGRRSRHNGRAIAVRACADISQAMLYASSPHMFKAPEEKAAFARIEAHARFSMFGADCYAYGLLALGFVDLIVEADLDAYDFGALVPVVEGAGGRITDWQGRPLTTGSAGQVVAAGDARVHAQALALLNEA